MLEGSESQALEPPAVEDGWPVFHLGLVQQGLHASEKQESKGNLSPLSCLSQPLRDRQKAEQARGKAPVTG